MCQSDEEQALYESRVRDHVVHLGFNVSSSTHNCGCMVDGDKTAIRVLNIYIIYIYIYICF